MKRLWILFDFCKMLFFSDYVIFLFLNSSNVGKNRFEMRIGSINVNKENTIDIILEAISKVIKK